MSFKTYRLVHFQEKYSDKQQQLFELVNHLHLEGLGYRRISKYLNQQGHKTHTNKDFTPQGVYYIIKRNIERQQRLELIQSDEKLHYGKCIIKFLSY